MTDNFTTVDNYRLDAYKVSRTPLQDGSIVQSMNAILPFISNYEDLGTGTTYTGYALRGSSEGEAKWFIMKTEIIGSITKIRFASEPFTMNQIWDSRASLSYV